MPSVEGDNVREIVAVLQESGVLSPHSRGETGIACVRALFSISTSERRTNTF